MAVLEAESRNAMAEWRAAFTDLQDSFKKRDFAVAKILASKANIALERAAALHVAMIRRLV